MSYDYAVHSDFLIHWTGKDIDAEHQPTWYDGHHHSKTVPEVENHYLHRLREGIGRWRWIWMHAKIERLDRTEGREYAILVPYIYTDFHYQKFAYPERDVYAVQSVFEQPRDPESWRRLQDQ